MKAFRPLPDNASENEYRRHLRRRLVRIAGATPSVRRLCWIWPALWAATTHDVRIPRSLRRGAPGVANEWRKLDQERSVFR